MKDAAKDAPSRFMIGGKYSSGTGAIYSVYSERVTAGEFASADPGMIGGEIERFY